MGSPAGAIAEVLPSSACRGGTMRTQLLHGFDPFVHSRGGCARDILERHEIDPEVFADPEKYISCGSAFDMLEYCSRKFNDPLFGLELAQYQGPDAFGCLAALARTAPSMREALEVFITHLKDTASSEGSLELLESGGCAEVVWNPAVELRAVRQINYQGILLMMKTLRMLGRRAFQPRFATLPFGIGSRDQERLERLLGCSVRPRSEYNRIVFDAAVLQQPMLSSNPAIYRLLLDYVESLAQRGQGSLEARIDLFVQQAICWGRCSIHDCARFLGLPVRTLQRHLAQSGTSFSHIVDRVRAASAKRRLLQAGVSIEQLALELGFAEQASFGRAFKRWTGHTPGEFAKKNSKR